MGERYFKMQGEVLEYLHSLGLKIGKSKLSSDFKAGRLPCTSDKRFSEADVLAYAESLKAPATEEKKEKQMEVQAEAKSLNALLFSLLKAMPQPAAVEEVLQQWLAKHGSAGMEELCDNVKAALERIVAAKVLGAQQSSREYRPVDPTTAPRAGNNAILPLHYYVQGSASEPYQVIFSGEGQTLKASCSCPAGRKGRTFCKHIAWLLKGNTAQIADGSDDITALSLRAAGSPLLEKAGEHALGERQRLEPVTGISSIKDIAGLAGPLVAGTDLWSEYATAEDGSEFLTVYVRKMYKNGKPYKNPTPLLSISYEPIIYQAIFDEVTPNMQNKAVGKRTLPYLVGSTNYGRIETAAASFLKKLKDIAASCITQN